MEMWRGAGRVCAHTCCEQTPPLHTAGRFGRAVLFSLFFEQHMEVAPRQAQGRSSCLWVSLSASPFPHQQGAGLNGVTHILK